MCISVSFQYFKLTLSYFLFYLLTYKANPEIVLIYLDTHRTTEDIYSLENLNFLCLCEISESLENWYIGSTDHP